MKKEDTVLLQMNHAEIGYDKEGIVSDLSFQVTCGDYLCIVGENGAGKSTLLKTILGFVPIISGNIVWKAGIKNRIGYLPQQTSGQRDFPASVLEVLLSGFLNQKKFFITYRREEKEEALYNLKMVGMLEFQNKCYRELSGGQQQRVLLARSLCAAKDVLVLDEPVTGLDPMATRTMYEKLQEVNKKKDMAIIMVSHDLRNAIDEVQHVLHINNGSYFYGTAEEYLGSEYCRQLTGGHV